MSDLRITTGPFCPEWATEEGAAPADDTRGTVARSSTRIHAGLSALGSMPIAGVVIDVAAPTHPDDVAPADKVARQLAAVLPFELSQDAKSEVVAQAQEVLQAATDMGLGPLVRLDICAKADGTAADPASGVGGSPEIGGAAQGAQDLGIAARAQSAVDRRDWNEQAEIAVSLFFESARRPLSPDEKAALMTIADNPQSNEKFQVQVYEKASRFPSNGVTAFEKGALGFGSGPEGSGVYGSLTLGAEKKVSAGAGVAAELTGYAQGTERFALYGSPPVSGVLDPHSYALGAKGEVLRDFGVAKAGGGVDVSSAGGAQVTAKIESGDWKNKALESLGIEKVKGGLEVSATMRYPFDNVTNQSIVNLAKDALWNDWLEGYRDNAYRLFGAQSPRDALAAARANQP
jgi:hypothetical protein